MTKRLANPGRRGVPKDGRRNPGWDRRKIGWDHLKKPGAGPATGSGYGGEARGQGYQGPPIVFTPENQPPAEHKRIGQMEAKDYRERLRAKLATAETVYDAALADPDNRVRLMAVKQIEDRVMGQAKQVVETQEDTRTPDEIRADIERKRKAAGLE